MFIDKSKILIVLSRMYFKIKCRVEKESIINCFFLKNVLFPFYSSYKHKEVLEYIFIVLYSPSRYQTTPVVVVPRDGFGGSNHSLIYLNFFLNLIFIKLKPLGYIILSKPLVVV